MASIIRIKRSSVAGNPSTLAAGELAYSALPNNDSNGGDRLYIGSGTETAGNAANHFVIGGKYFTDLLDHTRGVLTASSAIITDVNSKIDNLKVDNLDLNDNTLSSTNENGNILLDPAGTGYVQAVGTNVFVLPVGNTAQRQNNVQGAVRYNTETSSFEGYSGTNWGSLGGVKSVDGLTYITAESSPGASNDTLSFVTDNIERLFIDTDSAEYDATVIVKIDNDTQSTATTNGALVVAGGVGIAKDLRIGGDIYAANLRITNNTISSTNTNGNILLTPNGTGKTIISNLYIGPDDTITEFIQDTVGTQIVAGEGIDVTYNDNIGTLTIDAEFATTTNKGVASFADANFTVTDGAVSIKDGGVSNAELVNSSVTFGSTTVSLGSTSTSIAGITELTVDNLNINGNVISSTNENGNISIDPNGTGSVDVNGAHIINVANPVNAQDAATKSYVDNVAEGLHIHEAAQAATTNTLATLTGGTVTYDNGTNGFGATLTLQNGLTALDGYTLTNGDRILVKNEVDQTHNGIYVRTSATILTRATDFDSGIEIAGGDFTFVEHGTLYQSTGWVQTNEVIDVGSDIIAWQQFSGSGTFTAGNGLSLSGSEFNVGGTADRITVSTDAVDIASTYIGQTSITTLGTIGTGTWQGTTIATGYGGTGLTTYSTGDIIYASAANTLSKLSVPAEAAEGKILQISAGLPVWGNIDGGIY